MFYNISGKIKGLAIGAFIAETIGALITGICLWADWGDVEGFMMFLAVGVGGCLVALCSSWLIYGFGELIENTGATVTQLKSIDKNLGTNPEKVVSNQNNKAKSNPTLPTDSFLFKKIPSDCWQCKTCGKVNKYYVGTCGCGQSRIEN